MIWLRVSSRSSIRAANLALEVVSISRSRLTYPRQRITHQHVDNPAAAIPGSHQHRRSRLFPYFTNDPCSIAAVCHGKSIHRCIRRFGRHHGEKLAFVGDVQWIKPQQLAGPTYLIPNWNLFFKDRDSQAAITRQFIERSSHAAPSRIAHPANPRSCFSCQRLYERQNATSIGAQIGFEIQIATSQQNGYTVIADRPGENHFVTGTNRSRIHSNAGHKLPHSGSADVHLVGLAMLYDLGITADDGDARLSCSFRHGPHLGLKHSRWQSLFQHKSSYQGFAHRSRDSQVIHGAIYG